MARLTGSVRLARRPANSIAKPIAGSGTEVPESISSLAAWWRADSGITLNGSNVSDWDDKTGTYTISQSTPGNQPLYNSTDSNFNDRPTITFDSGTFEWLEGASGLATSIRASASSIFVVARRNSGGSNHTLVGVGWTSLNSQYIWFYANSSNNLFYRRAGSGTSDDSGAATIGAGDRFSAAVTYSTSESQLYLDGATDGAPFAMANDPSTVDVFAIGSLVRTGPSNYFDGEIAEVAVYSTAITAADVLRLHNYAAVRYGI